MNIEVPLSEKQEQAFEILNLESFVELVYGGGARGGKTWLGSFWIISMCKQYPGSGWLIGREELKALKRTTLRTFFKVLNFLGLKEGVDYKMNYADMVMTVFNQGAEDSTVFFSELKEQPSDPEFDRLGSYDLTGCWIDEAQEVSKNAKDTLQARFTVLSGIGYNGESWSVWPSSLYTCNPGKNWIYSEFWRPIEKEKQILSGRYFVKALYTDNPEIDHDKYREAVISTGNKVKIERLLHGNFDYDDTPGRLVDYDAVCDLFGKNMPDGFLYITADVAREGNDKSVVYIWSGWKVVAIYVFNTNRIDELAAFLKDQANKLLIPMDRIIVDAVGMGSGVQDILRCRGFVGNRSAIQPAAAKYNPEKKLNYADLNAQCGDMLAKKINARQMAIMKTRHEEEIKEELDLLIQVDVDKDKPMRLLPKDKIKEMIGRSPDFRDALMMRMYFELVDVESEEIYTPSVLSAAEAYANN